MIAIQLKRNAAMGESRGPGWRPLFLAMALSLGASCTSYQPAFEFVPFDEAGTTLGATSRGVGDAGTPSTSDGGGSDSAGSSSSSGGSGSGSASSSGSGGGSGSSSGTGSGSGGGNGNDAGTVDSGTAGGGDGSTPTCGGGSCCLSVTVTTVTDNGGYSPRNIGAIWVAHSSGTFVKTLAVWARSRINHLTLWNSSTRAAGFSGNTVDAVTGATLSTHQTHHVTWNCADTKEVAVPAGAYRVYFEMTDDNVTGPSMFVDFTKGSAPLTLSPPDAQYFIGINLVFAP